LSNLHLGARDPESGQFVMLGKTFKGLTDAMLRWQTERLLSLETHRDEWTVYVQPKLVVEIAYNDLQESPRYPGGLALRFARVRRYREDKSRSEADTIQGIQAMFEASRLPPNPYPGVVERNFFCHSLPFNPMTSSSAAKTFLSLLPISR
jgi:DNA ligase-1